jgi:hypothetical protein
LIIIFFDGIIFNYKKGAISIFLLDLREYFKGTTKFYRVEILNIDIENDWLIPIFPLHLKDSIISAISDTSKAFCSF